jgi:hypothetical protein
MGSEVTGTGNNTLQDIISQITAVVPNGNTAGDAGGTTTGSGGSGTLENAISSAGDIPGAGGKGVSDLFEEILKNQDERLKNDLGRFDEFSQQTDQHKEVAHQLDMARKNESFANKQIEENKKHENQIMVDQMKTQFANAQALRQV